MSDNKSFVSKKNSPMRPDNATDSDDDDARQDSDSEPWENKHSAKPQDNCAPLKEIKSSSCEENQQTSDAYGENTSTFENGAYVSKPSRPPESTRRGAGLPHQNGSITKQRDASERAVPNVAHKERSRSSKVSVDRPPAPSNDAPKHKDISGQRFDISSAPEQTLPPASPESNSRHFGAHLPISSDSKDREPTLPVSFSGHEPTSGTAESDNSTSDEEAILGHKMSAKSLDKGSLAPRTPSSMELCGFAARMDDSTEMESKGGKRFDPFVPRKDEEESRQSRPALAGTCEAGQREQESRDEEESCQSRPALAGTCEPRRREQESSDEEESRQSRPALAGTCEPGRREQESRDEEESRQSRPALAGTCEAGRREQESRDEEESCQSRPALAGTCEPRRREQESRDEEESCQSRPALAGTCEPRRREQESSDEEESRQSRPALAGTCEPGRREQESRDEEENRQSRPALAGTCEPGRLYQVSRDGEEGESLTPTLCTCGPSQNGSALPTGLPSSSYLFRLMLQNGMLRRCEICRNLRPEQECRDGEENRQSRPALAGTCEPRRREQESSDEEESRQSRPALAGTCEPGRREQESRDGEENRQSRPTLAGTCEPGRLHQVSRDGESLTNLGQLDMTREAGASNISVYRYVVWLHRRRRMPRGVDGVPWPEVTVDLATGQITLAPGRVVPNDTRSDEGQELHPMCLVCRQRAASITIYNCRHRVLCNICVRSENVCPL